MPPPAGWPCCCCRRHRHLLDSATVLRERIATAGPNSAFDVMFTTWRTRRADFTMDSGRTCAIKVVKLKAAAGAAFGLMIVTGGASAGLPKLPSRERFGGGFDIFRGVAVEGVCKDRAALSCLWFGTIVAHTQIAGSIVCALSQVSLVVCKLRTKTLKVYAMLR